MPIVEERVGATWEQQNEIKKICFNAAKLELAEVGY